MSIKSLFESDFIQFLKSAGGTNRRLFSFCCLQGLFVVRPVGISLAFSLNNLVRCSREDEKRKRQ
jgi:hypothetical protein